MLQYRIFSFPDGNSDVFAEDLRERETDLSREIFLPVSELQICMPSSFCALLSPAFGTDEFVMSSAVIFPALANE